MTDATLNLQAEFDAVGLSLFSEKARGILMERLRPDHFSEPAIKDVWRLILDGVNNPSLIVQRMADHRGFAELGGPRFLADCIDAAPCDLAAEDTAEAIVDAWTRRELSTIGGEIQKAATKAPGRSELILHDCERAIAEIARGSGARPAAVSAGLTALDMLEGAYSGSYAGQKVGIEALDHVTGGIRPEDVWIIAGRTSMGKSVTAVSLAKGLAEQGLGVLFFSLEMPMREVQARLIADMAYDREVTYERGGNVRYGDILKGRGEGWHRDRARDAAKNLASLPISVNDQGGMTISDIRSQTLRQFRAWEKAGIKPGACIIDHIGLVIPERRSDSKAADTADTVNELKPMAKQTGAPVIALCQVNRQTEGRNDKRPTPSDLNWSGAIEQAADLICLLYRESYYLERSSDPADKDRAFALQHELELIIGKNRSGPICTVKAHIDVASNAVRSAS